MRNSIAGILDDTFKDLTSLVELKMGMEHYWYILNKKPRMHLVIVLNNVFLLLKGDNYIADISREMFRNMIKLEDLHLYSNQIEAIPSNTFDDLASLDRLFLGTLF